jgi:hypothetical protein
VGRGDRRPATGDLRLNYKHKGLLHVQITGGTHPLLLLLADTDTAKTFWRQDTADGPVLVRGMHLLRGAVSDGSSAPTAPLRSSALRRA